MLAVSLAIVAGSMWSSGREREALLQMSPEARARVYEGAISTLAQMCPERKMDIEVPERCRRDAQFLSQFPECDDECRRLVAANTPKPTR